MSDGWGDDNVDAAVTSQGGDEARGGGDGGCRKCGEEGHYAKECPQRAAGDNKCRNCREVRKSKFDLIVSHSFFSDRRVTLLPSVRSPRGAGDASPRTM